MSYTEEQYREKITFGQSNNTLTRLIVINLVVFITLAMIKVFYYFIYKDEALVSTNFTTTIVNWFVLSGDTSIVLSRPWTLLTAIFTHIGFWSIFANMLWLWTFGYIMQDLTGNRKIIPLYIYGGLAGSIAFLVTTAIFQASSGAIYLGGSAGITAIAVATTMVSPGYRIFPLLNGGFPLWVLTVFYLLVSIATVPYYSVETYIPHLAGAGMGLLFIWLIRQGYDWSDWMSNFFDWVNNLFNPDKPKKGQRSIKDELFYKASGDPYIKTQHVTQQRIDAILDKINHKGYNSLTEEEKDLLKRASKEGL